MMATWANLSFQDSASPMMEQLSFFHDHTMAMVGMITVVVGFMITSTLKSKISDRYMLNEHLIEIFWTSLPAMTLILVAMPSLYMLYISDDLDDAMVTIKTMGRQWYWSYEYSDFMDMEFDSYMTPEKEMIKQGFRLLDVDNRMIIPIKNDIRVLISASDVLHSWAIPSMGVKVDAIPGRLNQTLLYINRPGLLFGQCSEICGANHSFMPIVIEGTSPDLFIKWMSKKI
uniref:Cytochrome c oxidase subunit 2 n=1 Tax=Eucoptacra sp. OR509 TaxID=2480045 RepID=A0A3G2EY64_9ORTH|nr:cytochrome c oxidase subunit 2 [Eucoptacra sp. OR509]